MAAGGGQGGGYGLRSAMDTAQFLGIDDEGTNLVLSFALDDGGMGVKTLGLIRTPAFETLLDEEARGVTVFMEGDAEVEDMLVAITADREVVRITTPRRRYEVDVSGIEKTEWDAMVAMIGRMNFDSRFEVSIG